MKALQRKATYFFKWTLLSALCGIISGLAAALFLYLLAWATQTRDEFSVVIWALPLAGFVIGWVYYRLGGESGKGQALVYDEARSPQKLLPLQMAPLVLFGTIATHFFGGSAGREGTAVQMGAALSDQLSRFFKIESNERRILIMAGAAAGFSAAIGTPWAGFIFGVEVVRLGRLQIWSGYNTFIAAFVAYYVACGLNTPHSVFSSIQVDEMTIKTLILVGIVGVIFGLAAKIFSSSVHCVEYVSAKTISYPALRPFIFGLLIVVLYYFEASYRFVGLGIPVIQAALLEPMSIMDPLLKGLFTALTIGSGFKGGEFIPLVFIGTTLGSALSLIIPLSVGLLGAVGFAAVFAAVARVPLACTVMAIELFGLPIAPYALLGCFISYFVSGWLRQRKALT